MVRIKKVGVVTPPSQKKLYFSFLVEVIPSVVHQLCLSPQPPSGAALSAPL